MAGLVGDGVAVLTLMAVLVGTSVLVGAGVRGPVDVLVGVLVDDAELKLPA